METTVPLSGTMTDDTAYKYSSLPNRNSFRYLVLKPGRGTEPLVVSLKTVELDEAPNYEAISYTWGVAIKKCPVTCDAGLLWLTANLEAALRQVRYHDKPRTLWADSICINQTDLQEQAQQVSLMSQIYSRAARTLICVVGRRDDAQHASNAANLVSDINTMIRSVQQRKDFTWGQNCFPFPEEKLDNFRDPRWKSLGVLLQQPWFKRCWVVQEVALGQEARLLWAAEDIDWLELLRVYYWINYRAPQILDVSGIFLSKLHARMFEFQREKEAATFSMELQFRHTSLLKTLDWARALDVTDPRDRIYAFLSLATCRGLALQPDYTLPYLPIYQDFAQKYVSATSDLDILHAAHHNDQTIQDSVSSWVPRWDVLVYHIDCFHKSWEKVTMETKATCAVVSTETGTLKVRALMCGTVTFASDRFDDSVSTMEDLSSLWTLLSSSTICVELDYNYSPLRAFVRTMRLGIYGGGWHEWTDHEALYMSLVQGKDVSETHKQQIGDGLVPSSLFRYAHNRKLVVLSNGVFGLAPGISRDGDLCSIILGTRTPFILRQLDVKGHFKILGAVYVLSKELDTGGKPRRVSIEDWRPEGHPEEIFLR